MLAGWLSFVMRNCRQPGTPGRDAKVETLLPKRFPIWQLIGMTLSDYLAGKGLTAAGFAKQAGLSKAAVSRWLSGARVPDSASARKILTATDGAVDVGAVVRRAPAQSEAA